MIFYVLCKVVIWAVCMRDKDKKGLEYLSAFEIYHLCKIAADALLFQILWSLTMDTLHI